MSDFLAARGQMAISLAFHIVFAVAGIAKPFMMVIAESRWLKCGSLQTGGQKARPLECRFR